jgi:4-hydroxy-3-methylbut-2-en-1-yl diphosphate synthase IspG/GcpE
MVESAFEFADICRDNDYHNFLFSMKVRRGDQRKEGTGG